MECDAVIVGAGAAGLATAIFAARPDRRIVLVDGAKKLGAKILVSGGGRCNVTNTVVTPEDYFGGSRNVIRRVLNAFGARRAVEFFREIGVALHEEPDGKLFPDTNSARTVLDALVAEARKRGVRILPGHRVTDVAPGFTVTTSDEVFTARRLVLATGGLSLPKTGSDGQGYEFAKKLGHTIVPTTPALAPLVLDGDFHVGLSGVTQDVEIKIAGERFPRSMLWTHFGVSGPAAMDASRVWHRTKAPMTVNLAPGVDVEAHLLARKPLSRLMPARVAEAIFSGPLDHLTREERKRIVEAVTNRPLPVRDSRGYNFAEVTAGGVPLSEIDPSTLESRRCAGLFLVGEILDVDGRIGGFNFQWAWSSGYVAGTRLM